jgi:CubicO group peptidase (beta-lactamase class C family)
MIDIVKRGILYSLTLLPLVCISVIACGDGTKPETLVRDIDAIRIRHHVPSVAFTLVSRDRLLLSGALGVRDRKTRQATDADTLFRIGSITKAFTSMALLKVQEQGKLSLSDPLSAHVSDAPLSNRWRRTHPVRIAHLLEHTAGLLDLTKAELDHSDPEPLTLRQGLFFGNEHRKVHWPPGLHSSYSNAGPGYAAYALEAVTKQRHEDFVKQELFIPLEMYSAGFSLDKQTAHDLATGYDTDGDTVIPYWHMILRPSGAINVKPLEMGHFVQMLLNRGLYKGRRILQEASIARMEQPRTTLATRAGLTYGYGLGNYQTVHDGFLFHGHGGDGDGYLAHYAYNRDTNLGYFLVINAFNHDAIDAMRDRIENFIITGHQLPPSKTTLVPVTTLKGLTGTYQAVTYRFHWILPERMEHDQIEVLLIGDTLYTRTPKGKRQQLIPVTPQLFRRSGDPIATIAFIENDGNLYLQGDFGSYRRGQEQ